MSGKGFFYLVTPAIQIIPRTMYATRFHHVIIIGILTHESSVARES